MAKSDRVALAASLCPEAEEVSRVHYRGLYAVAGIAWSNSGTDCDFVLLPRPRLNGADLVADLARAASATRSSDLAGRILDPVAVDMVDSKTD